MKYLIDSYAWIEYLGGTLNGKKVEKILSEENETYSIGLTVVEVVSRTKRKDKDVNIAYDSIILNSQIIDVTPEIAKEAGLLHAEMRKTMKDFGLVDSILLVLAKKMNAKIITGDKHFRNFKEAILIK